ncbi:LacI family DNA-binding transcriptional regulator [Microbacterium invictum]|uniref:LacI family DNA-binding transcriptional regulator n=1 Tax=Microbacterium invictum TaxID=515415 RepID=A0ABZ0VDW4_9MICO|nr:LacI family DNA-binding transcriptional regulator [Microbacterium invictum]WQB70861.1 LacI family DNA-binding transcriptional regulator [Microbacterium invictum]
MPQDVSATKPVGIEDVARAASVSITTVSHALSGRGQVAQSTRERVRRVAEDLGYVPNRLASALRGQRSQILGFVSDDIATTPFATRVVLGAQDAASERGQLLVVVNSNSDRAIESRQISGLLTARIDAVVYARMFHQGASVLPPELTGIPTALVDTTDQRGQIPSVVPDEEQIGRLATETLLAAGHTRIAHLTVSGAGRGSIGRLAGYTSAMRAAGFQPRVFRGGDPGTSAAGREAFAAMLDAGADDVTAVFSFNDPMSMGIYQEASRVGVSIPDDLSVVSVDDFEPVAAALLPGLTTVSLPHYEMGRWGVRVALELLDATGPLDLPVETRLPGTLVSRQSLTSPRSRPSVLP